jgi:hypothetical protein
MLCTVSPLRPPAVSAVLLIRIRYLGSGIRDPGFGIRDLGPGAFLTPGSGIRDPAWVKSKDPDPETIRYCTLV